MSLLEKIEENRKTKFMVCNDPQYVDSGEFAEDFDEAYYNLVQEAISEGISDEEIDEAAKKGKTQGETDLAGVLEARRM